ncbi:hypothetical protein Fmac_015026 [Flemingia macrophylla]|uniref:GOST seven transmembrane domain-containing protein n=1 Tax=Flemingia macrophylla TaxID=520843 RepID=A0ABD1ME60_9FABA
MTTFKRHTRARLCAPFPFPLSLLLPLLLLPSTTASIHGYSNEPFAHHSNALFFHGGNEALFAKSFIRRTMTTSISPNASKPSSKVPTTPFKWRVNATDMYYLYFMFYDPLLKGTIIEGRTVWRNCKGYLPGKMALLMTLYDFVSLDYLLLGLGWFLRARPMGITLWAVTFTSRKKTLSWFLLLVVYMGYGVVRPTLGGHGIAYRVLLFCLLYFVAFEALKLVKHLVSCFWCSLLFLSNTKAT